MLINGYFYHGLWRFIFLTNGGHSEKEVKVVFQSEIVKNANESKFCSSKIAASGHFGNKLFFDLIRREMKAKIVF
jgi:hypothetical protein